MSWLKNQLSKKPHSLFIEYESRQYTYAMIDEMVQIFSKSLIKQGIVPQDRILICLPIGIELIEIIFSCFEIGAIAVPISTSFTQREHDKIVKLINPKIIVSNWKYRTKFSYTNFSVLNVEEMPLSSSGCSISYNNYNQYNKDICTIILTSGTTGMPKAVQLTYENFSVSCKNWNNFLNFNENDQFLCCLPLYHIGGLAVLIRALIYGFSVNLSSQFDENIIINKINKDPVTIISLVPTMLKRILDSKNSLKSIKSLRWILLGGGPSPASLLNYCIKEKLNIIKVYGMTETCSGTVGLKLLDEPHNKMYAGRPFDGANIQIRNKQIYISGPMVMKGYIGERNVQDYHNSQDLGYIDHDNLLFLDIRRKDLIVSGGENINPIEIEEELNKIDGIIDSAVIGQNDKEWGQKVIAYIVRIESAISIVQIKEKLKKELSNYKIPKKFIDVSNVPRNELGKIIYDKLELL